MYSMKTHDHPGAAETLYEIQRSVVVYAALYDRVDFYRLQARAHGVLNTVETRRLRRRSHRSSVANDLRIETVEADGDAFQAPPP